MSRFIDEVGQGVQLRDMHVVSADNVFQYYYQHPREEWSVASFCMAPPWRHFWIEGKIPHMWYSDAAGTTINKTEQRRGVEFKAFSAVEDREHIARELRYWHMGAPLSEILHPEARWLLLAACVTEVRGAGICPVGVVVYSLDASGYYMAWPPGKGVRAAAPQSTIQAFTASLGDDAASAIVGMVNPALLTLQFLNCKNTVLERVEHSAALQKKHVRRHGKPLVDYHVLRVMPVGAAQHSSTSPGDSLDPRRLHICRGHFKRFTKDAPLFGKHTGTYWWASTVRGSADAGVALKQYQVEAS